MTYKTLKMIMIASLLWYVLVTVVISLLWEQTTHYKVDFVTATSTETFPDYLNRQSKAGWELWGYKDYSEGREYIFKK